METGHRTCFSSCCWLSSWMKTTALTHCIPSSKRQTYCETFRLNTYLYSLLSFMVLHVTMQMQDMVMRWTSVEHRSQQQKTNRKARDTQTHIRRKGWAELNGGLSLLVLLHFSIHIADWRLTPDLLYRRCVRYQLASRSLKWYTHTMLAWTRNPLQGGEQ